MSFSKAKLKRFNDVDVVCGSPAANSNSNSSAGSTGSATPTAAAGPPPPERKEQIEKFFKDAVRFASSSKEAKEFAIPKEDKKSKGLRLFRTPSLPQRLRFRPAASHTAEAASGSGASTAASTPLHSATTTPVKEAKSANRLKGKEALQQEIRNKNELIESYLSQLDVVRRHVDQLKETELKMREEHEQTAAKTEQLLQALGSENLGHKQRNEQLSLEQTQLLERYGQLEEQLQQQREQHERQVERLLAENEAYKLANEQLQQACEQQQTTQQQLQAQLDVLQAQLNEARGTCSSAQQQNTEHLERIESLQSQNAELLSNVQQLKLQIEQDALAYGQETKISQTELECLRVERNTLKNDLANKCTLIRSLQDELLDKSCEIDAHCDTIRQLCQEQAKQAEQQQAQQQVENELESAVEREKCYWRAELDKRQKLAENELIKIELEKQDVMVLLETTNDMLRQRDEKLQKCEEQLRNGIDYYIQLSDTLQQQLVQLKQDMAKTITEKYNYQLTLNNTRSTVNILMERLKKSDADVEQYKSELESVQLAKGALEQSYLTLQADAAQLRQQLTESQAALEALRSSSQTLQQEVSLKESMLHELLASESDTLAKFNKIANSFQERIDGDAQLAHYCDMYSDLKRKDETRELYMADMKKALDEFATVLQFAQLELDNKEQLLLKVREECEQLKLENIALKSKQQPTVAILTPSKANKPNTTDLEKIEDLLIDSELRAECDKITSWLLNSSEKNVRQDNNNELSELLACKSPKTRTPRTPHSPRTPRTPKSAASTPKKSLIFASGKENVPSPPQKQVLKARNM